ncbi:hypothetical protein [Streptomyces sp. ME18-1-4]|uniref:hypothetical protein n=1 Tax=Streptomyces sp. ME18-1-4 TaxID=3028685 RepID=UPI0029B8FA02|nr:hypothetical protein [Streptomyces sp. ME18-1-4]MDX3248862.1 hypothetical protein [Streptomyces sp. ME18-1-4]
MQFGQIDEWGDPARIIRSGGALGPAAENRLPPAGRGAQDPAMSTCDARPPLPLMSAAALPAPVQQQPGRHRRRDTVRP